MGVLGLGGLHRRKGILLIHAVSCLEALEHSIDTRYRDLGEIFVHLCVRDLAVVNDHCVSAIALTKASLPAMVLREVGLRVTQK